MHPIGWHSERLLPHWPRCDVTAARSGVHEAGGTCLPAYVQVCTVRAADSFFWSTGLMFLHFALPSCVVWPQPIVLCATTLDACTRYHSNGGTASGRFRAVGGGRAQAMTGPPLGLFVAAGLWLDVEHSGTVARMAGQSLGAHAESQRRRRSNVSRRSSRASAARNPKAAVCAIGVAETCTVHACLAPNMPTD